MTNALQAKILAPEFDQYVSRDVDSGWIIIHAFLQGMVIAQSVDRADPWPARLAIARSYELIAPSFTAEDLEPLVHDTSSIVGWSLPALPGLL